jgi:hypothetical protein
MGRTWNVPHPIVRPDSVLAAGQRRPAPGLEGGPPCRRTNAQPVGITSVPKNRDTTGLESFFDLNI